jgi:hypothetical protein
VDHLVSLLNALGDEGIGNFVGLVIELFPGYGPSEISSPCTLAFLASISPMIMVTPKEAIF